MAGEVDQSDGRVNQLAGPNCSAPTKYEMGQALLARYPLHRRRPPPIMPTELRIGLAQKAL